MYNGVNIDLAQNTGQRICTRICKETMLSFLMKLTVC